MKRVLALVALAAFGTACNGIVLDPVHGAGGNGSTQPVVERLTQVGADKIDLLFVVSNDALMTNLQPILALSVQDLLSGLANPPCLDDTTGHPVAVQPAAPGDACPDGSTREFPPVLDMHIGVMSSSLGTFGTDGCPDIPPPSCPMADTTPNDDHGHLVTRSDSCDSKGPLPTYKSQGFLAWDPEQKLQPPGIATVGFWGSGLAGALQDLVIGDGASGCGFVNQNEAWYRFLVDPSPYESIVLQNNQVVVNGVDQTLLAQRQAFLRPDSLLIIINVAVKTDGSIKETSSYPLFAAPEIHLPHARQDCITKGPTDPCCASCGQATPSGCAQDPLCTSSPDYTSADENTTLRAHGLISHKARYGIEFMYPPSRYVRGLKSATVMDANGKVVPNPIYTNLDPVTYPGGVRDPTRVFYAAIVGVPWQLIARQNLLGQPDLLNGVSAVDNTQIGGFKTAAELDLTDLTGNKFWDDIAGDPENYVPAKSPFMVESTTPRSGIDPTTLVATAPVTTPNGAGNPFNDHERTIATPPGDIEYACIFPLPSAIDESSGTVSGDCGGNPKDSPLCSPNPNDQGKNTLQTMAAAYPGIKHLAIARGMVSQGIVGSICPKQVTDPLAPDFGYRPAMRAIVDAVKQPLRGQCFPRALTPNAQGQVACMIIEGTKITSACTCDNASSRSPLTPSDAPAVHAIQADPAGANLNCFCEIDQAPGFNQGGDCQIAQNSTANGWCYVDAALNPAEAPLVLECPTNDKRQIRFVGTGAPQPGASIFIVCQPME
jgi:hypothetical protein